MVGITITQRRIYDSDACNKFRIFLIYTVDIIRGVKRWNTTRLTEEFLPLLDIIAVFLFSFLVFLSD